VFHEVKGLGAGTCTGTEMQQRPSLSQPKTCHQKSDLQRGHWGLMVVLHQFSPIYLQVFWLIDCLSAPPFGRQRCCTALCIYSGGVNGVLTHHVDCCMHMIPGFVPSIQLSDFTASQEARHAKSLKDQRPDSEMIAA